MQLLLVNPIQSNEKRVVLWGAQGGSSRGGLPGGGGGAVPAALRAAARGPPRPRRLHRPRPPLAAGGRRTRRPLALALLQLQRAGAGAVSAPREPGQWALWALTLAPNEGLRVSAPLPVAVFRPLAVFFSLPAALRVGETLEVDVRIANNVNSCM
ncbi:LOW QUALITY PROTEIN: Uncharacterized protein GBIM_20039, partial [Gryllus bimaculatus]